MKRNEKKMMRSLALGLCVAFCTGSLFAENGPHDISKQFDAVIKVENESKVLKNETIDSNEDGKNAVFVQGKNGVVTATGVKIHTKQNGSRGFYAAFGGTINAANVAVTTEGEHCAAFATDMGEGTVTVDSGSALTKGKGSPVIYSTGDITVKNLKGTAENSEIAVIEGKNSVKIEKSNLTGGSGLDGEVAAGIMLYQSMSGDANVGTASFTVKNSSLTNTARGKNSAFFYVTNTKATINLEKTKLLGNSETFILVSGNDSRRGWGRSGANGGVAEMCFFSQNAKGDVIVDEISSLKITLDKKSSLAGAVNSKKQGKVDIYIKKGSKLEVTADSYFNKFEDDDSSFKNIKSNGHVIYYNEAETPSLKGRTILLSDGGKISPAEYDFTPLENALAQSEKGGKQGEKPVGQHGGQPPKMELTTLTGTLNIVSDKAMLIDADNKATLLSVMEEPGNGRKENPPKEDGKMPPQGGNGNMQMPPDMQPVSEQGSLPPMQDGKKGGNKPPKPVTMDDLKKFSGKKVEIQGILEQNGTLKVFTITAQK